MSFLCFNGKMIEVGSALLTTENRSFRYGDGLFETMKLINKKICLEQYHFDRLFFGLGLLKIQHEKIQQGVISSLVKDLCALNHFDNARVRLSVYRELENTASYIIEAMPLPEQANNLNEAGYAIDIYPYARKSCDAFSNLKSANYLPYVMADLYARENGFDESLVLNTENNICDASKANIFLVITGEVYTPALHQGCVSGVKRRFVIDELKKKQIRVHQKEINESLILEADEVFLTNAINDIRWVKTYRSKTYTNTFTTDFYESLFATIY